MTKGSQMKKITMDVAYDESLEETMAIWGETCPRVFVRIARRSGPMGGWPVLDIVASERDLEEFLRVFGVDPEDVEDYMGDAEEVG